MLSAVHKPAHKARLPPVLLLLANMPARLPPVLLLLANMPARLLPVPVRRCPPLWPRARGLPPPSRLIPLARFCQLPKALMVPDNRHSVPPRPCHPARVLVHRLPVRLCQPLSRLLPLPSHFRPGWPLLAVLPRFCPLPKARLLHPMVPARPCLPARVLVQANRLMLVARFCPPLKALTVLPRPCHPARVLVPRLLVRLCPPPSRLMPLPSRCRLA